ncbi:MAG: adenine phosphoribosyltransferase [SAR202 cluster bacterium Io17-Chloro-G6]|nr:MAG: adenine phosphoribosyltransferase [SAR202 cluster bacterium Io17-Chloro-G6]
MDIKEYIRDVPDFPEPGIIFKDITPLLGDVEAFGHIISQLVEHYRDADFDVIVPIESRGFLFGAPLAHALGKSIVPVRKPGKLPSATHSTEYSLEYGSNTMEIHVDGMDSGQKVLIMDDLLATGGTLAATARLVEMAGGIISEICVIIELTFLEGRKNLTEYDVYSMVQY